MKNLVKTTGPFMLIDPQSGDEVSPFRPSVVTATNFIASRITLGQLKLLSAQVPAEATDKEFAAHWAECVKGHDGNAQLAMESFLSDLAAHEKPLDNLSFSETEHRRSMEEAQRNFEEEAAASASALAEKKAQAAKIAEQEAVALAEKEAAALAAKATAATPKEKAK